MTANSPKRKIAFIKTYAKIHSFIDISIQDGIESLNLSNNLLFDFIGFEPPERLKTLIINDNPIISFEGFPSGATPCLEEISFINCPISKLGNFRSLCIIVFGSQLKMINGTKVTRNDHIIALKYGTELTTNDSKTISQLLTFGWLPKNPIILEKSTIDSIYIFLERHNKDPFSLKLVSKLRKIGYSRSEIKNYIRLYFSPNIGNENDSKKINSSFLLEKNQLPDHIETQLHKQQELINALSVQIQSLRSGNKSFNAYDKMIKTIGSPLIKNAEIVNNKNLSEIQSKPQYKANAYHLKISEEEDYEELRNAAIDLIQEDAAIDDSELIRRLSELIENNDES